MMETQTEWGFWVAAAGEKFLRVVYKKSKISCG